jgi:hypothetical protein
MSDTSAASKMRFRFFSVSPMYLLTTWERSMRYMGSSNSMARISAAIVLPVPGGPANRAVMPPSFQTRAVPQW